MGRTIPQIAVFIRVTGPLAGRELSVLRKARTNERMLPRVLLNGPFAERDVHVRIVESGRRIVPDVDRAIEAAWQATLARPGVRLFDGPVCRLESLKQTSAGVQVDVSRTSYRILVGTNFNHPEFVETHGLDVMANPLGVSAGLLTRDGWILMGRRNESVAYYPSRAHPFAGSLEVAERINLFANIRRELHEELSLSAEDLTEVVCLGFAEDAQLVHPEAVFMTTTHLDRARVEAQLDADEHHATWAVRAGAAPVARAITDPDLTPIARAVLLMWGRITFGEGWHQSALR